MIIPMVTFILVAGIQFVHTQSGPEKEGSFYALKEIFSPIVIRQEVLPAGFNATAGTCGNTSQN